MHGSVMVPFSSLLVYNTKTGSCSMRTRVWDRYSLMWRLFTDNALTTTRQERRTCTLVPAHSDYRFFDTQTANVGLGFSFLFFLLHANLQGLSIFLFCTAADVTQVCKSVYMCVLTAAAVSNRKWRYYSSDSTMIQCWFALLLGWWYPNYVY